MARNPIEGQRRAELFDVFPIVTTYDATDRLECDAVFLREFTLEDAARCITSANLTYITLSEFAPSVPFAGETHRTALRHHIGTILSIGAEEEMSGIDTRRGIAVMAHK